MENNDAEEQNSKTSFESFYYNLLKELWQYWKKLDNSEGILESREHY